MSKAPAVLAGALALISPVYALVGDAAPVLNFGSGRVYRGVLSPSLAPSPARDWSEFPPHVGISWQTPR